MPLPIQLSPERQSARMSEIKNVGQIWMAKCNQLTSLPFKGLMKRKSTAKKSMHNVMHHYKPKVTSTNMNYTRITTGPLLKLPVTLTFSNYNRHAQRLLIC